MFPTHPPPTSCPNRAALFERVCGAQNSEQFAVIGGTSSRNLTGDCRRLEILKDQTLKFLVGDHVVVMEYRCVVYHVFYVYHVLLYLSAH